MLLKKISEHIYYLPLQEQTDRPNLYYIKGRDYSVAIDAGNSKNHIDLFYDELVKADLELPKYTIITHWHWDHTFGLKWVANESISSQLTYQKLQEVALWKWDIASMRQREKDGLDIPFCNDHILVEYANLDDIELAMPSKTINSLTTLDLGDDTITIIPQVSPHCDDGLFILDLRDKCLFVGDADGGDFYHNDQKYDRQKLKNLIAFYKHLDYDIHCFSHSEVQSKAEALDYLQSILNDNQLVTD
ncbi:MAG: MBL fold metallo-hydrolase [Erysipelotrichaceae bacterium]